MSAKITGNEPAMPTANSDRGIDFGLTIRQHYAGLAMQGIVSNFFHQSEMGKGMNEAFAKDAVALADALIEALNEDVTTP